MREKLLDVIFLDSSEVVTVQSGVDADHQGCNLLLVDHHIAGDLELTVTESELLVGVKSLALAVIALLFLSGPVLVILSQIVQTLVETVFLSAIVPSSILRSVEAILGGTCTEALQRVGLLQSSELLEWLVLLLEALEPT